MRALRVDARGGIARNPALLVQANASAASPPLARMQCICTQVRAARAQRMPNRASSFSRVLLRAASKLLELSAVSYTHLTLPTICSV
eukprot:14893832-Alexandrium_andersonii.AAC.1